MKNDTVTFGEVGLTGEIRKVVLQEKREKEAGMSRIKVIREAVLEKLEREGDRNNKVLEESNV